MTTSLLDELILLAYDDKGTNTFSTYLDYGLAGAALCELAFAERVSLQDKKLHVIDATPTGDPILDAILTKIAAAKRPRRIASWVPSLMKGLRGKVLAHLVQQGILRTEAGKVLWVIPHTRYPAAEGQTELALRDRMMRAVDTTDPVDQRTATMIALVRAIHMDNKVFPQRPLRTLRKRLDQVVKEQAIADGVSAAIREMQAAITASLAAVSVAASAS